MRKKIITLFLFLFVFVLTSCQSNTISISYSYTDPNAIQQEKTYEVTLLENEYIEVSFDKKDYYNKGEKITFEITNIKPGYKFTGWYVNDMYKGTKEILEIQVSENIIVRTECEKIEKVSKVGFSVGGQMVRHIYTDNSLTLTQEMLESVLNSISYLPYGYRVIGWQDKNGKEYLDGDLIADSLILYPIYEISSIVSRFQFSVQVEGGTVYNADTFKDSNNKVLSMGTILTFTALDEDGNVDNTKAWVGADGEIYSYKSSFTMTLVENLKLHTVDRSTLDTTKPILQSSDLFIERYLADTPHEYLNLRLYARVIIPLDYEHYDLIENYGAKMERLDSTGHRQRATFPLNKSQWSVNGEAWCLVNSQSTIYTYKGSSFIEFIDETIGDEGLIFNNDGWKQSIILSTQ